MLTVQYICDILKTELALRDGDIWIYNQRREIPIDKKFYIIVGSVGLKPIGVTRRNSATTDGLNDDLSQVFQEQIYIELFSQDTSAPENLPRVIGALNSTYSEQVQEKYGLKIGQVPVTINDISSLEGTSILYRFNITLNVIRAYDQTGEVDYYNTFTEKTYNEGGEV